MALNACFVALWIVTIVIGVSVKTYDSGMFYTYVIMTDVCVSFPVLLFLVAIVVISNQFKNQKFKVLNGRSCLISLHVLAFMICLIGLTGQVVAGILSWRESYQIESEGDYTTLCR